MKDYIGTGFDPATRFVPQAHLVGKKDFEEKKVFEK
jgi:hypothetical protein